MLLEDAFLYVTVDCLGLLPREAAELCREAVLGGGDVIELGPGRGEGISREMVERVAGVCREEGALLVIRDEPSLARDAGAAGVHLTRGGLPLAYARSILGRSSLVGLSSHSVDEAVLALELDPDFLIHMGGVQCLSSFPRLRESSAAVLFAGVIRDTDTAQQLIGGGVCRLCLDLGALTGSVTESVAAFSRLLGRDL